MHKGINASLQCSGLERLLHRELYSRGLFFRTNCPDVPGTPDVVFPREHLAVFMDGCFWHDCPIHGPRNQSLTPFWRTKLQRNRSRDKNVDILLRDEGWTVLRYWEHDDIEEVADEIVWVKRRLREQLQDAS